MITTECERLRDLLRGLEKAKTNKRVVESLNERQRDLTDLHAKAKQAFQSYKVVDKRESVIPIPDGTKAQKFVADLRVALKEEPESITKGRGFTTMKNAIGKIADSLNEATKETWKDFLAKSQPRLDANQVAQSRQLQAHKADATRLQDLNDSSKRAARKPPTDEEAFVLIESRWKQIRELIKSLPSPSDHPEIQAFLEAANSRNGASIELMTTEVLDWLKEQSMSKKFRIHQA